MSFKYLSLIALTLSVLACTNTKNEVDVVGVYKPSSKNCLGNSYEKSSCEEIKLIEITKGNFYKIEDHEYAFVIWSGESNLNYNARKLDGLRSTTQIPLKLFIENSESFIESVEFISAKNGKYEFGNPSSLSTINFVKADLKDLNKYTKDYPGNN
ncbi:hypothetical protein ACJJIK_08665 [Microbulbifer sp. ZKSA006]|uniref:hypothetical protein n=1 Tax=Microbulbifer sp. ZKSA006 TaxID=3243390 RepID=UPI00403A4896